MISWQRFCLPQRLIESLFSVAVACFWNVLKTWNGKQTNKKNVWLLPNKMKLMWNISASCYLQSQNSFCIFTILPTFFPLYLGSRMQRAECWIVQVDISLELLMLPANHKAAVVINWVCEERGSWQLLTGIRERFPACVYVNLKKKNAITACREREEWCYPSFLAQKHTRSTCSV